ncbi:unnamed protein product [Calicophoron daubneyi]|uniref:Saposin B-type domain-containing protein n=1 Tax=Calicophoron daubneyi TaxID=300641 RepID=A0AAV2TE55_CALDB
MRLLVFLVLIILVAASPLEDEINGFRAHEVRVCKCCKRAFGTLFILVTSKATKPLIDAAIRAECRATTVPKPLCVAALRRVVKYIQSHVHESDAAKVCKKLHIC